jgi:hypothetical protein
MFTVRKNDHGVPKLLWDGKPTVNLALHRAPEKSHPRWVLDAPGEVTQVQTQGLTWGLDPETERNYICDSSGRRVLALSDGTDSRYGMESSSATYVFLQEDLVAAGWLPE